jgi:hypothetical protein
MPQFPPGTDLNTTPAMKPPPGVTPNFVDLPNTLWPAMLAVDVIMIIWAGTFVGIRFFVKARDLGLSDCKPPVHPNSEQQDTNLDEIHASSASC